MRFYLSAILIIMGIGFIKVGINLIKRKIHFGFVLSRRPHTREIKGAPVIALGKGMFAIGVGIILGIIPVLLWRDDTIFIVPAATGLVIGIYYMTLSRKILLENDSIEE